MGKFYDLVRVNTATTGPGVITLGTAVSGFLTFVGAGVPDDETVTYAIADGANSEIGYGVVGGSGTTLTRSVLKSTNSNAPISLSGSAVVFITLAAEDIADVRVRPTSVNITKHGNKAMMNCGTGEFILRDQPLARWFHGDVKLDGALAIGGVTNFSAGTYVSGASTVGPLATVLQHDVCRVIDTLNTIFLPKPTPGRVIWVRMDATNGGFTTSAASSIGVNGTKGAAGSGGGGTASQNGGNGSGQILIVDTNHNTVQQVDLGAVTGSLTITCNGFVHLSVGGCGGKATTSSGGAGGGGANASSPELAVKPGDVIFYSIAAGSAGVVSWMNINTNAAPTSSTTGVKADFGRNGVTTTPGAGGATANCVGFAQAGTAGATLTGGKGACVAGTSSTGVSPSIKVVDGSLIKGSVLGGTATYTSNAYSMQAFFATPDGVWNLLTFNNNV
jgi:hypothetical protein